MSIIQIKTEDLIEMSGQEGLILRGCGGEIQEWIDGINELFTDEKILLNDTVFSDCFVFKDEGITCILFPFKDVELNVSKLAMWRIATSENLGGMWLSDCIDNHLDGAEQHESPERQKPDCPLIGQDGNIFNLMGIASRTLRENGLGEEAKEMCERIRGSDSYYEALNIIGEYVNITSVDEGEEPGDEDVGDREMTL